MFIRWVAAGTGPDGRFEAVGADRLIVPNGYVANRVRRSHTTSYKA